MTSTSRAAALAMAALLTAAALPAFALDGHAVYRAQVLGERFAAAVPSSSVGGSEQLVPGPQGRYLVYLGRSTEQAIAEARAAGEEPVRQTRPVAQKTRTVDGFEAYQRHLGQATRNAGSVATEVAQHAAPTLR